MTITAPPPPGRMGLALAPQEALDYLEALRDWRDNRRQELDQLDQAAAASTGGQEDSLTHDLTLSMALWKTVADRYDLLVNTWDSGRVAPSGRERLAALIWGRLDTTLDQNLAAAPNDASRFTAGLSFSLPEACRLSDALAAQLRVRLALDPAGMEVAERIRQFRAQLERIRDQVELEPASRRDAVVRHRQQLETRLDELVEKAGRGGDVGGLLDPLGIDAARFERDLIVGAAKRREASQLVDRAREVRSDLQTRETALQQLVDRCVATVSPAPKYAVPDVEALGPLPNTPAALQSFLERLSQVSRAMTHAQDAYSAALQEHTDLDNLLQAYRAKAAALHLADRPEVARAYDLGQEELHRRPTRMKIAAQLVALYQSYLQHQSHLQLTAPSGES